MCTSERSVGWGQRVAGGLAALAVGCGLWVGGGGSALAPEPAKLKVTLPASTGASASAYFVNSLQTTTVRFYSGSWTYDPNGPAVGTPCTTHSLVAGSTTPQVVVANSISSAYRKCI